MAWRFEGFEIDRARGRLLKDGRVVPLTGRAFDLLLALVEAGGQTVDKNALMRRLWPDTTVEEGNLTQQISTLRKALGESPSDHRFIVTVARRGYRFVAPIGLAERPPPRTATTVGRSREIGDLRRAFEETQAGRGILVCVTGEPGIGKSTLVGSFLTSIDGQAIALHGRCSERLTSGEPHLPVLEAL